VRLLVAEVSGDRTEDVIRDVEIIGLGRGVDATGRFDPERVEAALAVLRRYGKAAGDVDRLRAVATSATRDAEDAPEFLERATAALGHPVDVITGIDEAGLSFRGATGGLPPATSLVIDPGGGSTEFVLGEDTPRYSVTIDIGSVRLTERLLPDRPASAGQVAEAAAEVAEMFGLVRLPSVPDRVIGVAGTFTSLAAIELGLDAYDPVAVHGSTVSLDALDRLVGELSTLTVEETAAIPSLDPRRAPVLLAGAVVAREALRASGRGEAMVSERDLLDGIVLGLAAETP